MDLIEKASLKGTFNMTTILASVGLASGGSLAYLATGSLPATFVFAALGGGIPAIGGAAAIALTYLAYRGAEKAAARDRMQNDEAQSHAVDFHP